MQDNEFIEKFLDALDIATGVPKELLKQPIPKPLRSRSISVTDEWPGKHTSSFDTTRMRVQEGYAIPTSSKEIQPKDWRDPAGLWNPPLN